MTALALAIESARKRLGVSRVEYARRVGISQQALAKILSGGGVRGETLARMQRDGGLRITQKLVQSLDTAA